jgi:O-antigen/teichoic acid export membrane protein
MALIVSPMMSVGPKQNAEQAFGYYRAVGTQALCLALICSLCVYGVAIVSARWVPSWGFRPLALPLSVATGLYLLQDYTRRYFFTLRRAVAALTSDAISYLSQLGILWSMAFRHDLSSATALWVIAATSLLAVLASVGLGCHLRLHFDGALSVARRHWPLVRWLAPSSVLQWLSLNLFVVSAPVYYGIAAAGALRACQNVVGVCHIWFLGLENVLPGEAARELHTNGADAMLRYVRRMLVRWGLITATLILLIGLFPAFWLRMIYGAPYAQFGYVLRLYGVLYLMYFIAVPLRAGLQAIEFTAPLLWAYIAMTLFAALAAVPLAKRFGLSGVMVGLIATQLLFQAILASSLLIRARRMRREQLLRMHNSLYRWNEEPWNEEIEA